MTCYPFVTAGTALGWGERGQERVFSAPVARASGTCCVISLSFRRLGGFLRRGRAADVAQSAAPEDSSCAASPLAADVRAVSTAV